MAVQAVPSAVVFPMTEKEPRTHAVASALEVAVAAAAAAAAPVTVIPGCSTEGDTSTAGAGGAVEPMGAVAAARREDHVAAERASVMTLADEMSRTVA